jgi:hypothetical protein
MTAVLHGPPETGTGEPTAAEAKAVKRRCPECLAAVDTSKDWRKLFCSSEHRTAYHNRQTVRGRKLVPLVMAERITRSGYCRDKETGKLARQKSRQLMDFWNREDREAGRMPADEYIAVRERLGFNDADLLSEGEAAERRDRALERMTDAELLKALQETRSEPRLEKLRAERRRRQDQQRGAPTNA